MLIKNNLYNVIIADIHNINVAIVKCRYDLKLSLNKIVKSIDIHYAVTISHQYASKVIQKCMIEMANMSNKVDNELAYLIKFITADELHSSKFRVGKFMLYAANCAKSG